MTEANYTKVCTKCGVEKPRSEYHRQSSQKDGLKHYCKACSNAYSKLYRSEHPDYFEDYRKQYYEENRDRLLKQQKEYRIKNSDTVAKSKKRYREENREKVSAYLREYYAHNQDLAKEQRRQWREDNPEKVLEYSRRRRARKRAAVIGDVTSEIVMQMADDQGWVCAYCEDDISKGFEVEHMTPLIRGGIHHWTNIALACTDCNKRKHTKTLEEYMEVLRKRR